jgi:hypothetical protein
VRLCASFHQQISTKSKVTFQLTARLTIFNKDSSLAQLFREPSLASISNWYIHSPRNKSPGFLPHTNLLQGPCFPGNNVFRENSLNNSCRQDSSLKQFFSGRIPSNKFPEDLPQGPVLQQNPRKIVHSVQSFKSVSIKL